MADLQCVICDFKVVDLTPDDELLSLLGATPGEAGPLLVQHMESHSLVDWIRAFKMADAYISQLEGELAAAQSVHQVQPFQTNPVTTSYTFTADQQAWANEQAEISRQDHLDTADAELAHFFTPAEIAARRRREQIHQAIKVNPDETLIPRIPDAQRPEGVVGVKY